ncbi:MAG: endonuclease protein [Gemmatimonadetes bacterium]|nr:endonuclease protein [Gemmatimonadota bacterium]
MIDLFQKAGEATGYWGTRYLQAVRRKGGLLRAKEMLKPRTASQRSGLDALLAAGRPELTFEALVLRARFAPLFTVEELKEARTRLGRFRKSSAEIKAGRERLFPDELEPGLQYPEGTRRQVRVNAVERNAAARKACLKHHGRRCLVCEVSFTEVYGEIGTDFIHVHHLRPLASVSAGYKVDPQTDLVPVCPNCHAMLHREEPPLSVSDLRKRVAQARR